MKSFGATNAYFVILVYSSIRQEWIVSGTLSVVLYCLATIVYRKTAKGHDGLQAKKSIFYQAWWNNGGHKTGGAVAGFLYKFPPGTLSNHKLFLEDEKMKRLSGRDDFSWWSYSMFQFWPLMASVQPKGRSRFWNVYMGWGTMVFSNN